MRHTRRTVDFAAQVRARVVILHLGSVRFFWSNPGRKLRHYCPQPSGGRPRGGRRYQRLLAKGTAKLRRRMPPFWTQTRRSLEEILPYAAEKRRAARTGEPREI